MDNLVVVFTKNNARLFFNPENFDELSKLPNAVVNPDLSLVKNTPPHFWKVKDGLIYPMNELEMGHRLDDLSKNGVDNEVKAIKKVSFAPNIFIRIFKRADTLIIFITQLIIIGLLIKCGM